MNPGLPVNYKGKNMCNCLEEIKEKLQETVISSIKDKDSGFVELKYFGLKDFVFSLSDKPVPPFMLKFEAEYERKAKTGRVSIKKMPVSLKPTYCPLCGEKYD